MEQKIQLKYINKSFQIGLVTWKEAYILHPTPEQLLVEVYKGNIVYRRKGSPKRIYYNKLKDGLVKTEAVLSMQLPKWMR
jgi:hypothetical protein